MALPLPISQPTPQVRPATPRKRHLAPASAPEAQPRRNPIVLAIIGVVALLAIFATQLALSIAISQNAYQTDNLILEERELSRAQRELQQDVDLLASPQYLSQEALKLGMVQNTQPAYLRLESATLVGDLKQQTMAPRANLIANAALTELLHPGSTHQQSSATAKAETANDTPAAVVEAAPPKPTGPVAWNGKLAAPDTH